MIVFYVLNYFKNGHVKPMTDKDKKGREVGLVFKVQGNEKDNHSG